MAVEVVVAFPSQQEENAGGTVSLAIAFKGPEGVVIAADSRVTLTGQIPGPVPGQTMLLPASYDNATKLLRVPGQDYVGAVTFGLGALGEQEPRTAHSFLTELETELRGKGRLSVEEFSNQLGSFFMKQWARTMPPANEAPPDMAMIFLVGGYDAGAPYGRLFQVVVPHKPVADEQSIGQFGALWGGQREYVDRLIQGYDDALPVVVQRVLGLDDATRDRLAGDLKTDRQAKIPYQFLPLQDCVDLAIMLIRTTILMQRWIVDVRGVGGAIDIATITRTEGFKPVQQKEIRGERS